MRKIKSNLNDLKLFEQTYIYIYFFFDKYKLRNDILGYNVKASNIQF